MSESQPPPRAALYVDFDNVFLALLRWDERAAYAFGERPDAWLAWLEAHGGAAGGTRQRILVRRCYLNPGRYVDFPAGGAVARYRAERDLRSRTWFSEFRAAFVQAGFDVVDCPPVASLKNAADMKMALDIRDALDHPTRFDEFILLSGDSDFLPALTRLRAHDRRITILAQDTARAAYLAAADRVVGLEDFANEGMGSLPVAQFGARAPTPALPARERALPAPRPAEQPPPRLPDPARAPPPDFSRAPPPDLSRAPPPDTSQGLAIEAARGQELESLRRAVLDALRRQLTASPASALRLTEVGQALARLFPALRHTAYAGAGSLAALIEEAGDRRLSLSGPPARRWVFDADRGPPPGDLPPGVEEQPGGPLDREPPLAAPSGEPPDQPPPPTLVLSDVPAAPPSAAVAPPPPAATEPPITDIAIEPPTPAPDPDVAMAEAALLVRDLLWGSRDARGLPQDLPAMSAAELGFVLAAIAGRQPIEPTATTTVAGEIAAASAARGLLVSGREVTAVLRWLARGHARLAEPPAADDAAPRLGRVLYATLLNALRAVQEQLSEAEKDALRSWTQSGLPPP